MTNDIHIANPKLLEDKIKKIEKDGNMHFYVISDFDMTLTSAFVNGKKTEIGFGQIRAGGYLSPEYVKESYALHDKYYPFEIDGSIPIEEKKQKMLEWWQKHLEIMVKYGLNRGVIEDITRDRRVIPREESLEFYEILHKHSIPLLIFSAGSGDLIEGFLNREEKLYSNTQIIANFYDYDEKGFVKGYKSEITHSFNKNGSQVKKIPYYEQVKGRRNVMLLGDSIGDLGMTEGLEYDTILRIDFLNENAEGSLPKISELYDIIVLNNGPMGHVNKLLRRIIK